MNGPSIFWYDFETYGDDPRRDRASQFAGIRTDEALNIIGEPLVLYCKPSDDFLPSPIACQITGITPQHAQTHGVNEAEFIKSINDELSKPQTCVAGYNNIRFDDELTRQLLYRNFFDPYEREWKNGNSRWDIIDMVRLCAATRPDGMAWPKNEDGTNSFKLGKVTEANGIEHKGAHDALVDVLATIEVARLIRKHQPKLFDYIYQLRDKRRVQAEIGLDNRKPALHISATYPSQLGCLALVMPLCIHPTNSNGIIVYDLRENPRDWIELSADEIRARVYTPADQLPNGIKRVALNIIYINKCPIVTSPAVLDPVRADLYEVDFEICRKHWDLIQNSPNIGNKIQTVFQEGKLERETDPDYMIYSGGFFSDNDRSLMQTVRATSPNDLARIDLPFRDKRLHEMLFRYRARNYRGSLNQSELERWNRFRLQRLTNEYARQRYESDMQLAMQREGENSSQVLSDLQNYVDSLTTNI